MGNKLNFGYRFFILEILALLFLSTVVNAQLTINSAAIYAIDNYTIGEKTHFEKSDGEGNYSSPGLNHITIIRPNNKITIEKGCFLTIEKGEFVIKENDVIHNKTGGEINISGVTIPNSKVAYIIDKQIVIKDE